MLAKPWFLYDNLLVMPEIGPSAELQNSLFLTEALAKEAIKKTIPEIQKLIDDGTFSKPDMYLALAVPVYTYHLMHPYNFNEQIPTVPKILAEYYMGDVQNWEYPYDEFAINKINICARTGMSVRQVLEEYPHLIHKGDVIYPGAINENGVIAGMSSIEDGDKDEIGCQKLLDNCYELIQEQAQLTIKKLGKAGVHYF
jgi:hypothetical protein